MKTIFIIAPHFPPSSLPPAHRVRLLVNHLQGFGWKPVVFTVKHEFREEIEDKWMEEITNKDFDQVLVKCFHQSKMRRIGIGDLGLRMLPFLTTSIIKYSKKYKPDFILYPVPPWYLMTIAPFIKRVTKVPYGIDFIDPWVRKPEPTDNVKAKLSQWVARKLEGKSVKASDVIFAVSDGIINDLHSRYKIKGKVATAAIPYGVEISDFNKVTPATFKRDEPILLARYIGAISDSMLPVARSLLQCFSELPQLNLQAEFIGTSYAGAGLVKSRLQDIIKEENVGAFVKEFPSRVDYKTALSLQVSSDILLLFGDLTPYYAASKLMGLVATQKPFIGFLHRESFPAIFLKNLGYPYFVTYTTNPGDGPDDHKQELKATLQLLINNRANFEPVALNDPHFLKYTAEGMTKNFITIIEKQIYGKAAL